MVDQRWSLAAEYARANPDPKVKKLKENET
jgi:hypothetical protein